METTSGALTNVHLTLRLTDAAKLPMLLELLRHIDFIETADAEPAEASAPARTMEETPGVSAFHALAGIWEGRDITAEQMRQQTYLRRTVNYDEKS